MVLSEKHLNYLSCYSKEFCTPINEKLKTGYVLCDIRLSRMGGFTNTVLLKPGESFDKILDKLRPQAIVVACLEPKLLYEGDVAGANRYNVDRFKEEEWEEAIAFLEDDRDYYEILDQWISENINKRCLVFKDPDWHLITYRGIVPMQDGTIQFGAY